MITLRQHHMESMRRVLIYIEKNYDDKITLSDLGKVAGISPHHFQRLFSLFMNESPGDYLKRVRLEKAKHRMQEVGQRLTDVALDVGFSTPSAFAEAFRKSQGLTPREFKNAIHLSPEKLMTFFKKVTAMNSEILPLEARDIFFVRKMGNYFTSAPAAWQELDTRLAKAAVANKERLTCISMGHDNPHAKDVSEAGMRYDACLWQPEFSAADRAALEAAGFEKATIAAGLFARFDYTGAPDTLGKCYHYIYGEWLYSSGYSLRDEPAFVELRDYHDPKKPASEWRNVIYLPISPLPDWHGKA